MANAVLDGVDGILLGAETLRGKYAVQTVQTILAICHQAEKAFDHNYHFEHLMQASAPPLLKLRSAAVQCGCLGGCEAAAAAKHLGTEPRGFQHTVPRTATQQLEAWLGRCCRHVCLAGD